VQRGGDEGSVGITTHKGTAKDDKASTRYGMGGSGNRMPSSSSSSSSSSGAAVGNKLSQPALINNQEALPPFPLSIDSLTEPLLMHIAEMMGPAGSETTSYLTPASFMSDISSMIEVCHERKKVVRSSDGLWSSVCQ